MKNYFELSKGVDEYGSRTVFCFSPETGNFHGEVRHLHVDTQPDTFRLTHIQKREVLRAWAEELVSFAQEQAKDRLLREVVRGKEYPYSTKAIIGVDYPNGDEYYCQVKNGVVYDPVLDKPKFSLADLI